MLGLFSDTRYAFRQFRQSPAFTLTAVVTLALGIGGTTGIFSLVHAVMLRSLPVKDPSQLYRIGSGDTCCVAGSLQGERWGLFSYPLYQRLKAAAAPEFEQVAAFEPRATHFSVRRASIDRMSRSVRGEFVTGNYFSTLGIASFTGRLLSPSDDRASAPPVAVLSYRAWQSDYGADPHVIGSTFVMDTHPFTVIGIAPPGFYGDTLSSRPPDLWMPLAQEALVEAQRSLLYQSPNAWLRVLGRIRPGANLSSLPARLTTILRTWLEYDSHIPANFLPTVIRKLPGQSIQVIPAGSGILAMQEEYGSGLRILFAVCAFVLLIACANLANLMLARGIARRSQTSLRIAIGASRGMLIRQALTESVLLAIAGGALGLFVAEGAGMLILQLEFHKTNLMGVDTSPSMPVLAFAFGLSLLTGTLFGTAPAWLATITDPADALRGGNRSTAEASSRPQRALITLQASVSVILVAGAAMLTRSLANLEHQDFGFAVKDRVVVAMNHPPATYTIQQLDTLYRRIETRLSEVPGVEQAALALYTPLESNWSEAVQVQGHPPNTSESNDASWDRVSTNFLQAVGEPILRGRNFTDADRTGSVPVAIVNQAFVKKFFPHEDPIGRHFGFDLPQFAGTYQVIGIVRDAKYTRPAQPARPMLFVSLLQTVAYSDAEMQSFETSTHFIGNVLLVSHRSSGELEDSVARALSEIDPNLTVTQMYTMQEDIDNTFGQRRAMAGLTSLFGGVALVLAAVGLYGVLAYTVARRTSEIGVRIALGADKRTVVSMILRGAFEMVGIGLILGIPLAIGAGKLVSAQLYGVTATDPAALSAAVLVLSGCALLAAVIPALRAASINPITALRTE